MKKKYAWLRLYGFFGLLVFSVIYLERNFPGQMILASTSAQYASATQEILGLPDKGLLWVSKDDGSDQIWWDEKSSGEPIGTHKTQLAAALVPIHDETKSRNLDFYDDGPIFQPSGMQNSFLIPESSLSVAEGLGFKISSPNSHRELSCKEIISDPNTAIIFVFGQSNSANSGRSMRKEFYPEKVYSFFGGRCYRARDPMPGATCYGGKEEGHFSPWPQLGEKLVQSGKFNKVLFISIGWGGTRIHEWAPGGTMHARIVDSIKQLKKAGITPTHFFWAQGESDSNPNEITPQDEDNYVKHMREILSVIRKEGFMAPIYLAQSTAMNWGMLLNDGHPQEFTIGVAVRKAIARLIQESPDEFKAGAPTDEMVGSVYRYDYAHMNDKGLQRAAELWFNAIK